MIVIGGTSLIFGYYWYLSEIHFYCCVKNSIDDYKRDAPFNLNLCIPDSSRIEQVLRSVMQACCREVQICLLLPPFCFWLHRTRSSTQQKPAVCIEVAGSSFENVCGEWDILGDGKVEEEFFCRS